MFLSCFVAMIVFKSRYLLSRYHTMCRIIQLILFLLLNHLLTAHQFSDFQTVALFGCMAYYENN